MVICQSEKEGITVLLVMDKLNYLFIYLLIICSITVYIWYCFVLASGAQHSG